MTRSRTHWAVLGMVAAASVTLAATVPALADSATEERATLGSVAETVVEGACQGGGGMVLRIQKEPGTYTMTATAHGLPEGTRWRLGFSEGSFTDESADEGGRAVAVVRNGRWNVSRSVPAVQAPYFTVIALGPGRPDLIDGRLCAVLAKPAAPLAGFSVCHKSVTLSMVASYRDDVGLVVRWFLNQARPGTTWNVSLTASTPGRSISVVSRRTASPRGSIMGKDTFSDETNPRLRLSVIAAGGQRCTLNMHRVLAGPIPESLADLKTREGSILNRATLGQLRSLFSRR